MFNVHVKLVLHETAVIACHFVTCCLSPLAMNHVDESLRRTVEITELCFGGLLWLCEFAHICLTDSKGSDCLEFLTDVGAWLLKGSQL